VPEIDASQPVAEIPIDAARDSSTRPSRLSPAGVGDRYRDGSDDR
jgi:hypothetical protein